MKIIKGVLLIFLFITGAGTFLKAQDKRLISGSIIDSSSKEPVPYADISLKKHVSGTIANEEGKFSLNIPGDVTKDTLLVNSLGYKEYAIALSSVKSPLIIELEPLISELNEVVVSPFPPAYYIKIAMQKMKDNFPKDPFQTGEYYMEKVTENKNLLKFDECVFKTYYPKFLDTVRNQHQLMLYRKPDKVHEMKFMAKERKEQEEKEFKKHPNEKKRTGTDFIFGFVGPGPIIYFCKINKRNDDFLDSTKFKHYDYSFSESAGHQGMMVIDFKSKGKVGHLKKQGKIFIDPVSNAIFRIEGSGDFIIPLAYRPLLFLYGFSAQELSFTGEKEYQQINGRWYPENFYINFRISATKRRLFGTNEHADYNIEQRFKVLQFKDKGISPIDPAKKFNPEKEIESQIYNDSGINWTEVGIK